MSLARTSTWNSIIPTSIVEWDTNLLGTSGPPMWTSAAGANEDRPINFVNWFEVYAFCIWDGGFLPTESEYNYAAAGGGGGDGQRIYPWSDPPGATTIDCTHANYGTCSTAPNVVGAHSPKGDGKWGQSDLGGNVSEWLLDYYVDPLTAACVDCAFLNFAANRSIRGGGYNGLAEYVQTTKRYSAPAAPRSRVFGGRCARTP